MPKPEDTPAPAPLTLVASTTAPLDLTSVGDILVKSKFFSDTRDAAQAMVKVLAGRELGIPPVASMMGINVIQGKVAMSSTMLAALIQRSGRYRYRIVELTPTACRLEFSAKVEVGQMITDIKGRPFFMQEWTIVGPSDFNLQDAKVAGLAFKKTFTEYPRNMLFARALSNGFRWYCPELFAGGVYIPEELGADGKPDVMVQERPSATGATVVTGEWKVVDEPATPLVTDLEVSNVILILDRDYPLWTKKPGVTRALFGEPIVDPAHLLLFARQEPKKWRDAVASLLPQDDE